MKWSDWNILKFLFTHGWRTTLMLRNKRKKINCYLTQLKYKCQFLAFFLVFDKLFGTIYMIQDEICVESFFQKHFQSILYICWIYSWYCFMKPFLDTENTRRQYIIISCNKRHYSRKKDSSTYTYILFLLHLLVCVVIMS